MSGWQQIIASHGFKVIPIDENNAKVLDTTCKPGEQIGDYVYFDELVTVKPDGSLLTVAFQSGTEVEEWKGDYFNLRHFLGY